MIEENNWYPYTSHEQHLAMSENNMYSHSPLDDLYKGQDWDEAKDYLDRYGGMNYLVSFDINNDIKRVSVRDLFNDRSREFRISMTTNKIL